MAWNNFTGVSSPYEESESAALVLHTDNPGVAGSVGMVVAYMCQRRVLPERGYRY